MAKNPDTIFITEGPSLLEQMGKEEWDALTKAMNARGMPSHRDRQAETLVCFADAGHPALRDG